MTGGRASRVLDLVLLALVLGAAAATWWPTYQHPRLLLVVGAAIVLGGALALLAARARVPAPLVLLSTVALFALVGVPLAIPTRTLAGVLPTVDGLVELFAGVGLGWKQLLTITLPVGDYQALLVPPLALFLAAAVVSVSIALRVGTAASDLAVLPAILAYIAGIAFGPAEPSGAVLSALAMLGTVLLWLVVRRWRRRRDAIRRLARAAAAEAPGSPRAADVPLGLRAILAAVLALLLAAGGATAAVSVVPPTSDRDVLRTAIEQPFDPRQYPSPLSGFRRYLRDDQVDAVQVRVTGLPAGARIRIATLDAYDGVVYAVGAGEAGAGTFVRIPQSIDRTGLDGDRAQVAIAVEGYRGVWLPTVGIFESVQFAGPRAAQRREAFFFNETTGTAALLGGVEEGDVYTLDVVMPAQPSGDELAELTPGNADVPRLSGAPDELSLYVEDLVRDFSEPGERLQAGLDALRADGYISHGLSDDEPPSRAGHAADRIAQLVTDARMLGDAEQYAVAAALMARQLGFPARVVLGFAPDDGTAGVAVTGRDITAWIEVDTAQYGWVAIDPVPDERPIPEDEPEVPNQVARPPSIVPPPPDRPDPQVDQSVPDGPQEEPAVVDPFLQALLATARIVGVLALVLAVVSAPFLVVIAAKARRRRLRRTAPTPLARIRGGWDEFADTALDHGFEPPPAATRSELAEVVGTMPARVLAAVADRAVFAPTRPDDAESDRVWDAVADLRQSLDAGLTRRERFRAVISVRSLGAYSVRNLWTRWGSTS